MKNLFYLLTLIILGLLTGMIISSNINYVSLIKPPLAPPSWLFPVVWIILYILMGISYLLFKKKNKYLGIENIIYYLQLLFNLLWSVIFFTFNLKFLSCVWIFILDILVIEMIILFYKKSKISAILNIPYLCWILFATYLTIGIFLLN